MRTENNITEGIARQLKGRAHATGAFVSYESRVSGHGAPGVFVRGEQKLRIRRSNWVVRHPLTSWPGLSRPSTRRR